MALMKQSHRVIKKFSCLSERENKGIAQLSRLLGHRRVSTVQSWWDRGVIPQSNHPEIMRVARENDVPLEPADFLTFDLEQGAA